MQPPRATSRFAGESGGAGRAIVVEQNLLTYLRDAQNRDGGWGFLRGAESRVEPTSWAVLALSEFRRNPLSSDALARGLRFLEDAQLSNGSWPAVAGQNEGAWVTSLACWAFLVQRDAAGAGVGRGIEWLLKEKPGDAGFLWRMARRLTGSMTVAAQNPDYFGWSWTPGTSSWVEPTAIALIVLDRAMNGNPVRRRAQSSPAGFRERIESAEKMLFDRMCPGGGWNSGNPLVYGAAGEPQVGPTVWALLALRKRATRPEVRKSLEWLGTNQNRIRTLESMALTKIALDAFGSSDAELRTALVASCSSEGTSWPVMGAAWAALVMGDSHDWLIPARTDGAD
jgi:prenyltransferase/squalene oxidase-like repeat protein